MSNKYEEEWIGDKISGSDYGAIINFRVTTVLLTQDECGGVEGSTTEELTL